MKRGGNHSGKSYEEMIGLENVWRSFEGKQKVRITVWMGKRFGRMGN